MPVWGRQVNSAFGRLASVLGNLIDNILLVNSLPGMLVNNIFQNVYINTLTPNWLLDLDKQQVVDINALSPWICLTWEVMEKTLQVYNNCRATHYAGASQSIAGVNDFNTPVRFSDKFKTSDFGVCVQVLIRTSAACVSPVDVMTVSGKFLVKPKLPWIPGTDAAGIVEAVGSQVMKFKVICAARLFESVC